MTKPAFTPGPWRRGQEGNLRVYGPDNSGEHSGLIAKVFRVSDIDAVATTPELYDALHRIVSVVDAAGLHQLSRGVELGQTAWYVKASDAIEYAKSVLAEARGEQDGD